MPRYNVDTGQFDDDWYQDALGYWVRGREPVAPKQIGTWTAPDGMVYNEYDNGEIGTDPRLTFPRERWKPATYSDEGFFEGMLGGAGELLGGGGKVVGTGVGVSNLAGMLGFTPDAAVSAFGEGPGAAGGYDAVEGAGLNLANPDIAGAQEYFDNLAARGASAARAAGGGNVDFFDNWDLFGAGSSAVDPFSAYSAAAPAAAGDPIEALIRATDSGLSGAAAIKAVESQFPGSTQGWWDFFGNNPGNVVGTAARAALGLSGGDGGGGGGGGGNSLSRIIGTGLATGLGVVGANRQTDALERIAAANRTQGDTRFNTLLGREDAAIARQRGDIDFARGVGAPYRERLGALYSDPSAFLTSPEVQVPTDQAMSAMLRGLSTQGNPFGNPGGLMEANKAVAGSLFSRLGEEKNRLGTLGGLTSYAGGGASIPGLGTTLPAGVTSGSEADVASAAARNDIFRNLAQGAGDIFNPPRRRTLADLLKMEI